MNNYLQKNVACILMAFMNVVVGMVCNGKTLFKILFLLFLAPIYRPPQEDR